MLTVLNLRIYPNMMNLLIGPPKEKGNSKKESSVFIPMKKKYAKLTISHQKIQEISKVKGRSNANLRRKNDNQNNHHYLLKRYEPIISINLCPTFLVSDVKREPITPILDKLRSIKRLIQFSRLLFLTKI